MDIKTVSVNLKNLMNKWFYTREQIHQLLEDYVTVDNNGILNVGLPSAEKITLTTQNNAITTADVAEVTAKVTDSNNNATFGVPVQFVNRATREVLYNGTTDENGECDFQYFTEEAEILPIQARISNDYIFRDDGRLNSYTSWDGNTNVTLEHNSTNTRMYATDTSGATATLSSLVLTGYNDIDFKVKLIDGTATTDFCGIRECTSSGENVANGYTTDFNLDQLNLTVGEWYHFHISVLDDRFVLYCKETGENLRIWNDDGAPAYYKFVLYCDDDVSTIDFSDVRINKTSDDLSMFIKDKNCIYWETFNNQTINEGAYFRSSSDTLYSITNEYSTMGDYSLKAINSNWKWVYYGLPSALHNQITHPFSFKCDVYTTGGDLLIVVSSEAGAEKSTYITLSPGKYETEITYTPSEYNFQRIQLGYRSRDNEKTCYIDNIRLYIQ